jgi:CHAD domain-containing protein
MRVDAHLRQLTDALKESLTRCASDPDVEAVHTTRTGTRRIEAALEAKLRNADVQRTDESDPLAMAVHDWERLLKRVHRKLLEKLVPDAGEPANTEVDALQRSMRDQVEKLDHALHAEREKHAGPLKKNAMKWLEQLEGHFGAYAAAIAQRRASRRRKPNAAVQALDAFARLSSQMLQLNAGNLHDFRKGAKKARYMAEAGGEDEHAGAVGKALKKLQDEIGDWHDWLVLAEEAHDVLGDEGGVLIAEIERIRDSHYETAIKVAGRMRGKLMGEWLGTRREGTRALRARSNSVAASDPQRSAPRNPER